jgi:hypothetical protein
MNKLSDLYFARICLQYCVAVGNEANDNGLLVEMERLKNLFKEMLTKT